MSETHSGGSPEQIRFDEQGLYREEVFTDRKVGTIRQLTPVKIDGGSDSSRITEFVGQAQIMTPMGPIPLSFEIPAASLAEAIKGFPAALKEAVDRTLEEARELRRQASSSIVIPEAGAVPGNLPGGGKIKMP